ncbi:copper chaperone [Ulvibacter sp. MAR_2010_11]|uniref:heavy-metal-associated domain-containing protein n=1 Tax=Ulvibacter sp. MAR_2010_11 TaxID=1250229 RepID=UPI000C2C075C|nr:heavy-metal-associated domain-containing protein [Ulvibacter sp. MAR_2010_11]PKA84515.1 copper chaperone [Ulvibacter sp. MAR_2010_11]
MKTLKIQIPNMQSSHCQMRVNSALSTISGVTNITTQSGEASIKVPNNTTSVAVIAVIEKAGYYVTNVGVNFPGMLFSADSNIQHVYS